MKNVAIIDYKMGNLFSVQHACKKVGLNPIITSDPKVLENSIGAILPGVGAFGEAINTLRRLDLIKPIKNFIDSGKPFMGICLGYQLLFSESEEFGTFKGLEIFEGLVKKFSFSNEFSSQIKIPQIGWNQIFKEQTTNSVGFDPLNGIKNGEFMYFVHSYYPLPLDNDIILTHTTYHNFQYCSSINYKNIFASQFHPEKSGIEGLKIYKNWAEKINIKD